MRRGVRSMRRCRGNIEESHCWNSSARVDEAKKMVQMIQYKAAREFGVGQLPVEAALNAKPTHRGATEKHRRPLRACLHAPKRSVSRSGADLKDTWAEGKRDRSRTRD
eukprot:6196264-Pleurochrysis_carterae.AAC.3